MSTVPDLKKYLLYLSVFILLAVFVGYFPINAFDIWISNFVQRLHYPVLDEVMIVISAFGDLPVAFASLLITSLLFFLFKFKREAIFVLSVMGTGLITFVLKQLFTRPRPTDEYVTLIETYPNHSFPSGHTLSYIVFFGFLILLMHRLVQIPDYLRKTILTFSYFMFIMGPLSRIYLGAHWFTDILGGFLIGMLYLQILKSQYSKEPKTSSSPKI